MNKVTFFFPSVEVLPGILGRYTLHEGRKEAAELES